MDDLAIWPLLIWTVFSEAGWNNPDSDGLSWIINIDAQRISPWNRIPCIQSEGLATDRSFWFCFPCLEKVAFLLPFFMMQGSTAISCTNATHVVALTFSKSPQGPQPSPGSAWPQHTAFLYLLFYTACRQCPCWCTYPEISPRSDRVLADKYSLSEVKGSEGFSVN